MKTNLTILQLKIILKPGLLQKCVVSNEDYNMQEYYSSLRTWRLHHSELELIN